MLAVEDAGVVEHVEQRVAKEAGRVDQHSRTGARHADVVGRAGDAGRQRAEDADVAAGQLIMIGCVAVIACVDASAVEAARLSAKLALQIHGLEQVQIRHVACLTVAKTAALSAADE